MRAILPFLTALGTVGGAFLAAYLRGRQVVAEKAHDPNARIKAITWLVVAVVATLTALTVTVILTVAVAF